MNIGVLLLYCKEGRTSTFTQEWATRAMSSVADYIHDQSAGRQNMSSTVFDWIELPVTEAEWVALGFGAYDSLRPGIEASLGRTLDEFAHIVIAIDHSTSSGGTTGGALSYVAASNFTPSIVSHELAHRFGAPDAFGETPAGPVIYQNEFCVMGSGGALFDPALALGSGPMLNQCGPGMSGPTLLATGWLVEGRDGCTIEATDAGVISTEGSIVEIAALEGAPAPMSARPPVLLRYHDLTIEYRSTRNDGWDRGLPTPGSGAEGWIVVHRSPRGVPQATLVNSLAALPGSVLKVGHESPFDVFHPGSLRVAVLSVDSTRRAIRLQLWRRAARPLPGTTPYAGVDVGGGGFIWTPGRGFTRIPPRSPMIDILERAARLQELEELKGMIPEDQRSPLREESVTAARFIEQAAANIRDQRSPT